MSHYGDVMDMVDSHQVANLYLGSLHEYFKRWSAHAWAYQVVAPSHYLQSYLATSVLGFQYFYELIIYLLFMNT